MPSSPRNLSSAVPSLPAVVPTTSPPKRSFAPTRGTPGSPCTDYPHNQGRRWRRRRAGDPEDESEPRDLRTLGRPLPLGHVSAPQHRAWRRGSARPRRTRAPTDMRGPVARSGPRRSNSRPRRPRRRSIARRSSRRRASHSAEHVGSGLGSGVAPESWGAASTPASGRVAAWPPRLSEPAEVVRAADAAGVSPAKMTLREAKATGSSATIAFRGSGVCFHCARTRARSCSPREGARGGGGAGGERPPACAARNGPREARSEPDWRRRGGDMRRGGGKCPCGGRRVDARDVLPVRFRG